MRIRNCVYRFIDKNNILIYVGKAKDLDNRICSRGHRSKHLQDECYNEIIIIQYIEFETENDMCFAEKYYIQKYQPKYNSVYINNQITIDVPVLDNKMWLIYSVDNEEVERQLSLFSSENIIGHSKEYKYVSIKIDLDLFEFILFFILKDNYYVGRHQLFEELYSKNEMHKVKSCLGYENLEEEHKTYKNIDKLNKVITLKKNLYNDITKELDIIFVKYPLLNYKIAYSSIKIGNGSDEMAISEFNQCFHLGRNTFRMMILVYGRYCGCNICKNNHDCKKKELCKIQCSLEVECK